MHEPEAPTIEHVNAEPDVLRRAFLAAALYRYAQDAATTARTFRDGALVTMVHNQKMRSSDIERETGVPPGITNYAITRSGGAHPVVEQPIETARASVADVDRWETISEEAGTIRDAAIRDAVLTGKWTAVDIAWLTGLTRSRISQIARRPDDDRQSTTRTNLRLASLVAVAEELVRRAPLADARNPGAGNALRDAAATITEAA